MLLSSSAYFVFLVFIFLLYWPLSRQRALALGVILFANYFFYAKWDVFYLFLIPAASTLDFLFGYGIGLAKARWQRRVFLGLSLALNLGLLASLKYMPFILENYAYFAGVKQPAWQWSFPLGISFYCFQALTYTIDIYRRDAQPAKSYLAYLAAVSFFPTTLAGPITRVAALLPQLEKRTMISAEDGGRALFRIGLGLMKKLLVADYLAANLVNRVFDFPNLYSATEVLVGVYAYAFQLYFDFSGYTDIAIGSALLLGLKLPENFRMPYAAENIAEFWRRWHISLSNWLRDYLYFSLPGLRSPKKVFLYLNLILTMVIGGLWHGPNWTFVIWGLLHGCALAVVRYGQHIRGPAKPNPAWWARAGRIFVTFHFVCFSWIFFRASSLSNALEVLSRLSSATLAFANLTGPIVIILLLAMLGHYTPERWFRRLDQLFVRSPFFVQAAAMALLLLAIHYVATKDVAPFIYTKF
ncbi:MAG: MBOAT family protein [Bryobacteraceae bacterium]|nr:MBOAT family protein [Bryobacteraceae bacterium]MDW8379826.1 MBOAT family O-acyltransferase [Bryobacterales bacterium]